jgi:uncharacterized protein (UPF0276 family)
MQALLQHVTEQAMRLQEYLGRQLILENVTYMLEIPRAP